MTDERRALRKRRMADPLGFPEAREAITRAEQEVYLRRLGGALDPKFRELGSSVLKLARELAVLGCVLDPGRLDSVEAVAALDCLPVRPSDPLDMSDGAQEQREAVRRHLVAFWTSRLRKYLRRRRSKRRSKKSSPRPQVLTSRRRRKRRRRWDPPGFEKSPYGLQVLALRHLVETLKTTTIRRQARKLDEAFDDTLRSAREGRVPPGRKGGAPGDPVRLAARAIVRLLRLDPFADFEPWEFRELARLFEVAAATGVAPYLAPFDLAFLVRELARE